MKNKKKILKVYSVYLPFIKQIYQLNFNMKNKPYINQLEMINGEFFGWGDGWKIHLEETGKYQVEEVILNAEYLQKKWAEENKVIYDKRDWKLDILEAQIESFSPEILFLFSSEVTPGYLNKIRRRYNFVNMVVGYDGLRNNDPNFYDGYDMILSCLEDTVNYYKRNGFKGYFLKHAFDKRILNCIEPGKIKYDVSFIGGINMGRKGHIKRLKLLTYLINKMNINLRIPFVPTKKNCFMLAGSNIKNGCVKEAYENAKIIKEMSPLKRYANPGIYGKKMYQMLVDSKIVLNNHIDIAGNSAGNMRLFEATGVGACLLTDYKENLDKYFEIGKEIVAYSNPEDCLKKINKLLKDEDARIKIAKAGQKKTLECHTLKKRILEFEKEL